jgi:hypothetical protein
MDYLFYSQDLFFFEKNPIYREKHWKFRVRVDESATRISVCL